MPHQGSALHLGRVEQGQRPHGQRLHVGQRSAQAARVARQIDREHAVAVMGKPARQQRPVAVVMQRTVQKNNAGKGGIKGLAAGVRVGLDPVDFEFHRVRPFLLF